METTYNYSAYGKGIKDFMTGQLPASGGASGGASGEAVRYFNDLLGASRGFNGARHKIVGKGGHYSVASFENELPGIEQKEEGARGVYSWQLPQSITMFASPDGSAPDGSAPHGSAPHGSAQYGLAEYTSVLHGSHKGIHSSYNLQSQNPAQANKGDGAGIGADARLGKARLLTRDGSITSLQGSSTRQPFKVLSITQMARWPISMGHMSASQMPSFSEGARGMQPLQNTLQGLSNALMLQNIHGLPNKMLPQKDAMRRVPYNPFVTAGVHTMGHIKNFLGHAHNVSSQKDVPNHAGQSDQEYENGAAGTNLDEPKNNKQTAPQEARQQQQREFANLLHMRMVPYVSKQNTQMAQYLLVQLSPPVLGQVAVLLTGHGGYTKASVICKKSQTANLLKGDAHILTDALKQQGIQIGQIDFSSSSDFGAGQQEADNNQESVPFFNVQDTQNDTQKDT